jgi:hypothetical protein
MRMRLLRRRRPRPSGYLLRLRGQKGSQIVEFAMVLPLFLVFAIAAFDFGQVFAFVTSWTIQLEKAPARPRSRRFSPRFSTGHLPPIPPP